MSTRILAILALFLGLGGGLLGGWLVIAPKGRPPRQPPDVDRLGTLAPAPPPIAVTPVEVAQAPRTSASGPDAAGDEPDARDKSAGDESTGDESTGDESAGEDEDEEPLVPTTARGGAIFDDDITLIPRGPGRFAVLDLRSLHLKRLSIHAGEMERDGGGSFSEFAKRRKVGALTGPRARVELLHLGFDRDGLPTIAHIRPANRPSVEGIVSLRRGDRVMRVLPDRGDGADSDEPF